MKDLIRKIYGPWLPLLAGGLALCILLSFSIWSVTYVSRTIEREERIDLVIRAGTIALLIDPADIRALNADESDLQNPVYQKLKNQLTRINDLSNLGTRFVYIMGQENEKQFFYVDSEDPSSPDYSPPGQPYADASPTDILNYEHGIPYSKGSYTDAWGTWYTAYVPIIDASSTVVAMVGIDIPAETIDLRVSIVRTVSIMVLSLIGLLILVLTLIGRDVVLFTLKNEESKKI